MTSQNTMYMYCGGEPGCNVSIIAVVLDKLAFLV